MYLENFKSKEDVIEQFQIKPEQLEGCDILVAYYGWGSYEGDAFVLFRKDGQLYEVNGSHCSCYGLEDQWGPEETNFDALKKRDWGYKFYGDKAIQELVVNKIKELSGD